MIDRTLLRNLLFGCGAPAGLSRRWAVARVFLLVAAALAPLGAMAGISGPGFSKLFIPDTIGPGSVTTLVFDIDNSAGLTVTDLAFTDTLPAGVTIADPASAFTDCIDGVITAPPGGSTITFSDGDVGAGGSCFVSVDVTSSTSGTHTNVSGSLTSSAGTGDTATDDLTVDASLPGFSKSFAPSAVALGGRSTLTLTIDNSANASNVFNLDFTDNLPIGMQIADPAVASTTCGTATIPPSLTATAGTSVIILDADGISDFPAVGGGGSCTVTVDVTTTGGGMLDNVTGDLLAEFVSAGKASATLDVSATNIALQKAFTDDPVAPGDSATLEFTVHNFDRVFSATGVAFTDDLTTLVPALAGLTFDSLLSNDCGGSVSGVGGTAIGLSGGTLAPESSCTVRVSLSVPAGATAGSYTNTTSTVTATIDGAPVVGNMASDDLFVEPSPILTKEFLTAGTLLPDPVIDPGDDVVLRFTVTNTSATSMATDVAFLDELTDGSGANPPDTTSGFLPFPVTVTLPPVPDPPCGAGSSLALVSAGDNRQALELTGGTLAAAGMAGDSCTFEVTLSTPASLGPAIYLNTTEAVSATVDGATRFGDPASDTLTVIAAPQLTKAFIDDPVGPGGTVTLEFTLSYPADAPGDATAITFTDDLASLVPVLAGLTASGLPLVEACDPDGPGGDPGTGTLSGSAGDTLLTFMNGTLMPGESCTFSVPLAVPAGAASGTYTNTTSGVGATVQGLAATSAAASDDLTVAGLTFNKEFVDDPAFPGETLTLRYTIANIHPTADATITFFTDNLSSALTDLAATGGPSFDDCGGALSGTTFLFYIGGSVMSGMSCTIEVPVLVPAAADDGDYVSASSSLAADQGGAVTINPAVDILTVNANLLQLTKAFTDDPVTPGSQVTAQYQLTNLDAAQAASGIAFTDDLNSALSGLTFDSVDSDDCLGTVGGAGTTMIMVSGVALGAGGSCTIQTSLTVPGGATPNTYPSTTSAASGDIGGFPVTGDPASDNLRVIQQLNFSKSFDGPTTATGTAVLTFTITNPGASTATGLAFLDNLDNVIAGLVASSLPATPCGPGSSITGVSNLTFSGGELPPTGGTCSFDVEVLVPATATAGTFPNTTSDLFQSGLPVAAPASADLTIEPPPTFAKVFAPDFIGLGLSSTLTFTIDNSASAVAASSLDFTDNLPAGVVVSTPAVTSNSCGGTLTADAGTGVISLSGGTAGATSTCTVNVDVTGTAPGAFVNTADDLTSGSGNSGAATDTLTVNPQPGYAKSFAPDVISAGSISTLTFTIDNSGSTVAATSLEFSDTLPAPVVVASPANASTTCTGGTLTAAAGSGVISYTAGSVAAGVSCTVTTDIAAATAGSYVNTSGNLTSSLGDSGSAADTLTVNPQPGFAKAFAPASIGVGGASVLTFTIDNSGSTVAATGLDFTDTLPASVTVASPTNASTTCTGGTLTAAVGSGAITYTGGTVTTGASCTVMVDVTAAASGAFVNTSGNLTSSLGDSGTATDTLTVNPQPGFAKAFAPASIGVGGTSTLTFTIDNSAGTVAATGLDFTDNLPAPVLVASPANAGTTCSGGTLTATAGSGVIAYTSGTAAAGASCTVTVDVTAASAGSFVNTSGNLTSFLGTSGTATDTLTVGPQPGFAKSFAPALVNVGGISTLTFTIDNSSNTVAATGLDFTDNLPAPVVVASPANASTTCTGGTLTATAGSGVIGYTAGTAAAGASCTVVVDVTSATAGAYVNVSGNLTSSLGDSGTATDTLTVDGMAPMVTGVATVAGALAACDTVRQVVDSLVVTFEDDFMVVNADDVGSYLLVSAGPDGEFSTNACGGAVDDDVAINILSATVAGAGPFDATLSVTGLDPDLYRLLVCDTITDDVGNALDGDGDMTAGGDFVLPFFRADPLNLFENGHFDDCPVSLDPWVASVSAPNTLQPASPGIDDADGSPLSGSALVTHSTAGSSALGQCVAVDANTRYRLNSRFRFEPAPTGSALLSQSCQFFAAADCTGTDLGEVSTMLMLEDTLGGWGMTSSFLFSPAGAVSALCAYTVQDLGTEPNFNLYLDQLILRDGFPIFEDGFETPLMVNPMPR